MTETLLDAFSHYSRWQLEADFSTGSVEKIYQRRTRQFSGPSGSKTRRSSRHERSRIAKTFRTLN